MDFTLVFLGISHRLYNDFQIDYQNQSDLLKLTMMRTFTTIIRANILQNSKRLRTFSQPQEKEMYEDNHLESISIPNYSKKFQSAFIKMAENNQKQNIKIELTELSRLEVADKEGSLILQADSSLSTLFFSSPLGSTYKYYYDIDQKRFYSNKDGHLLDQNLSRQAHRYFGDILQV